MDCKELHWLIIESDSTDQTTDILDQLQIELSNFRFLSLGSLQSQIPLRSQRLAHCRNVYLCELETNPAYQRIDCVVVADLDGVNDLVTPEAFASCWERLDWDVCTANQSGRYYDLWALRHPIWCPNDPLDQCRFLIEHNVRREKAMYAAVYAKMIILNRSGEWIEVESAFGGLGVYRRNVLHGLRYSGIDLAGNPICEHVTLHQQLRAKGCRLYINPRLINTGETEHSRNGDFLARRHRDLASAWQVIKRWIGGRTKTA
jgi:hypothetical protein